MNPTLFDVAELDRFAQAVLPILWRSSWQAGVLALAVLVMQFALRKRLPARWRHAMWWVVLLRLLVPVTPPSPFSLFNVAPEQPAVMNYSFVIMVDALPPGLAPSRGEVFPWMLILAAIWVLGLTWMLLRIAWASVMLAIAVRRMSPVRNAKVLNMLDRCRNEMGVRRRIEVLTSPAIGAPALMGFLRPRLLLPPTVLENFDAGELRLILLHELAHLKRHDVAINWLASILHAVHWFNPIVWLAFARLRSDRELAADELVLTLTGDDQRGHYGDTLVKLLQTLSRRPALAGTVGILERAHPMRRRITMIAQFHRHARRWTLAAASCLLILAALGLTDCVRGQAPQKQPTTLTLSGANAYTGLTTTAPANAATRPAAVSEERYAGATNGTTLQLLSDKIVVDRGAPLTLAFAVSPEDTKVQAALKKMLPEVRFDAIGFSDTIDFLRDVTGANVTVNWRTLEAAGIDRNTPVSVRLKELTFEQTLTHILSDVGGGTVKLGFAVSNGSLIVTTLEELAGQSQLRSYNVEDLLKEQDKGSATAVAEVIKTYVEGDVVVTSYHERLLVKGTPTQQREVEQVLEVLRKKP